MSAGRIVGFTSIVLSLCFFCLPTRGAQPDAGGAAEIENSKFQFTGVINSNAVFVRSGPSENDYATMKLDRGAEVTVLGLRYEWLKIVPPEGSFCYVAKAYVDRRGNGSVGRVRSTLNVRIGSQLNELKAKIGAKLEPGADVEIVGEEQEYFKIRPPQGVYFYVNKQFVEPVRPVNLAQGETPRAPDATPTDAPDDTMAMNPQDAEGQEPPALAEGPEVTTTPPIGSNDANAPIVPPLAVTPPSERSPATQPTADAESEFERLERTYADASLKPLDEQPVSELLESYQKLAASDALPESLRRIAEFKAEVLKGRLEVQQQFAETRQQQDQMRQRQMALESERQELEQRIKENDVQFYTAVGTLRPSSLQQGRETLYRLTDPANGRTVIYLRTNDSALPGLIGQFIGVRGEVQTDAQLNLRLISPTTFEPVDPSKVGTKIAAQIVPPSLLPGTAQTE